MASAAKDEVRMRPTPGRKFKSLAEARSLGRDRGLLRLGFEGFNGLATTLMAGGCFMAPPPFHPTCSPFARPAPAPSNAAR